jgi:hypothetical protein
MLSMHRSCKEPWQLAMPCAQPGLMASTTCGSLEYGQRSWHWALGTGTGADLPAAFLHARPASYSCRAAAAGLNELGGDEAAGLSGQYGEIGPGLEELLDANLLKALQYLQLPPFYYIAGYRYRKSVVCKTTGPNSASTASQLVLRPHFPVHFVVCCDCDVLRSSRGPRGAKNHKTPNAHAHV